MKAALLGNPDRINYVWSDNRKQKLASEFDLLPGIHTRDSMSDNNAELLNVDVLFSTWGIPALTEEEIAMFPSLKAVFYAAGTVQQFARPFLVSGVKVFSAWAANAVPVAEYTVAQILMANKGFFRASRSAHSKQGWKEYKVSKMPGNFEVPVALLGAGMIGRGVIERLTPYKFEILVYDPFLSDEDSTTLGVTKVELDEAFRRGMVVSNHLANLPETVGMLKGEHFLSMQQNSTFINTGRGATVDEPAMVEVLRQRPDITAVLDVTHPEPPEDSSPLYSMDNVVLTPHIAGSQGNEVWRLADYMIDEAIAFRDNKPVNYEVTLAMLETMA